MINFWEGRLGLASAHVNDNTAAFLSVGVQLLPVLWLVLAVETTWLRSELRARTNRQRAMARHLLAFTFPMGAVGECLALFVLFNRSEALWLGIVAVFAGILLYIALAYGVGASATAMYRAIVTAEEE
jgi:hypothetical protein